MQEILKFKKNFWDMEISTKKCVHFNGAIEFNKTCLTNGIFYKYYNIRIIYVIFVFLYLK